MNTRHLMSSAAAVQSPFAHLRAALIGRAQDDEKDDDKKSKAQDDDDKKDDDKSKKSKAQDDDDDKKKDDDKSKKSKAQDEDDDDENKKSKAEDDEEESKAQDDDDDDKKKDDSALAAMVSALAAPVDGDYRSDRDDDANAKTRTIRARERGRISAILTSKTARLAPEAALSMALGTALDRKTVAALLTGMVVSQPAAVAAPAPKAASSGLRDRMADAPKPDVGIEGGANLTLAQQIILAGKQRRGEV